MLRVIETMTWVCEWLTTDDAYGPSNNQNYAYFNMLRGNRRYPVEFLSNEVRVCPMPWQNAEATLPMRSELLQTQYDPLELAVHFQTTLHEQGVKSMLWRVTKRSLQSE